MKVVYEYEGLTRIFTPAPGSRLLRAVVKDGATTEFNPPIRLDRLARTGLEGTPVWAETLGEQAERLAPLCVPPGCDWRVVSADDIPEDRLYRNALKPDLTHDMAKARVIHRDRLRRARKPLLEALDIEAQRALESGQPLTTVAQKKQVLRDVTKHPGIEAARSIDELAAAWPDDLPALED